MNSMNDQRFFDLAMKAIARQSTDAARAELDALLASQPELKAEFEWLQAAVRIAKEVLPIVAATESEAGEFPAYARERLQTKVRRTFGSQPEAAKAGPQAEQRMFWRWQWLFGMAAATALIFLFVIPSMNKSPQPIIQVAMIDLAGATRGSDTNEAAIFQQTWKEATVQNFSTVSEAEAWEKNWPDENKRPVAKIIYDRAAGEVRVRGRWKNGPFEKTFPVGKDLATAVKLANAFVQEKTRRQNGF